MHCYSCNCCCCCAILQVQLIVLCNADEVQCDNIAVICISRDTERPKSIIDYDSCLCNESFSGKHTQLLNEMSHLRSLSLLCNRRGRAAVALRFGCIESLWIFRLTAFLYSFLCSICYFRRLPSSTSTRPKDEQTNAKLWLLLLLAPTICGIIATTLAPLIGNNNIRSMGLLN